MKEENDTSEKDPSHKDGDSKVDNGNPYWVKEFKEMKASYKSEHAISSFYKQTLWQSLSGMYGIIIISIYLGIVVNNFTVNSSETNEKPTKSKKEEPSQVNITQCSSENGNEVIKSILFIKKVVKAVDWGLHNSKNI